MVVGGVVVAGALVFFLLKHHKKLKTSSSTGLYNNNLPAFSKINSFKTGQIRTVNLSLSDESSLMQKIETAGQIFPVDLIVAPISNVNNLALGNTKGIQVGFRVKF
jgi:hypothetical protein